MNGHVIGFTDGKKIQGIKGIRAATGLGLKDAKDVADHVQAGTKTKVTLLSPDHERLLAEHGVRFEPIPVMVPLADFIEILSRYPRSSLVGELVDVLRVAAEHEAAE